MNGTGLSVVTSDPLSHGEIVAGLFAEVFALDSVAIDDDFFEMGGDSLLGAALTTAIEKRFGLILSISILLEAPTPRALATAILEKNVQRVAPCLVTIADGGAPPAIFCVHGTGGESMAPLRLSNTIGRHPFYAFRAIGLEHGEQILTSVEAMATTYLTGIARARTPDPLILFGHCAGAIIAYEMAQQLVRIGDPPAGLVLVDPEDYPELAPYLYNSGMKLSLLQSSWRKRAAQLDALIEADPNPTGERRREFVAAGIKHAVGTYMPAPYDGPTLLVCTPERRDALLNRSLGYPSLTRDLETVVLTTNHTGMFKEGLAQVAEAVAKFIARLSA